MVGVDGSTGLAEAAEEGITEKYSHLRNANIIYFVEFFVTCVSVLKGMIMRSALHGLSALLLVMLAGWMPVAASSPIMGEQEVDAETMYRFVAERNPRFSREIAEAFHEVGELYGLRGDIALCQAIIETGWFRFDNGTAVRPEHHNYCGLGVHTRGSRGCSFGSVREGVTAMLQHLYAYACREPLPKGETMIDPRFRFVTRGAAPTWESLSGKWAMNNSYGDNILRIYRQMLSRGVVTPAIVERIEVDIPDHVWADLPYEQPDLETPADDDDNSKNLFE